MGTVASHVPWPGEGCRCDLCRKRKDHQEFQQLHREVLLHMLYTSNIVANQYRLSDLGNPA